MKHQTNHQSQANCEFVKIKEITFSKVATDSDDNIREGEIISVGKKTEDLKVGDKVIFDTNKSIKHFSNGQEFYYCNYKTIFEIL